MEKENVLQENFARTEQGIDESANCAKEECGSTMLGKFKDQNALLNAYGALEAEFTRRSQKLKALERRLSEMEKAAEMPQGEVEAEVPNFVDGDCLEKSNGEKSVELNQAVLVEDGARRSGSEKVGLEISEEKSTEREGAERSEPLENGEMAHGSVAPDCDNGLSVQKDLSDEEIYKRASEREEVRLKIVGDYLASLKKVGAPLARGGRGTIVSPPVKAGSFETAGNMALRLFKGE